METLRSCAALISKGMQMLTADLQDATEQDAMEIEKALRGCALLLQEVQTLIADSEIKSHMNEGHMTQDTPAHGSMEMEEVPSGGALMLQGLHIILDTRLIEGHRKEDPVEHELQILCAKISALVEVMKPMETRLRQNTSIQAPGQQELNKKVQKHLANISALMEEVKQMETRLRQNTQAPGQEELKKKEQKLNAAISSLEEQVKQIETLLQQQGLSPIMNEGMRANCSAISDEKAVIQPQTSTPLWPKTARNRKKKTSRGRKNT